MINLIPNEEKKKMSREFYYRLLAVLFLMLGVSSLVASVVILPSYFITSVEGRSVQAKLKLQESELVSLSDQTTLQTIEDLKKKLRLIENAEKNKFIFSQKVINEIVLEKISDIKITEILYENKGETGGMIKVVGSASSREALISFRHALEDNPNFSKIDLPVSNFIKGSNIKFYLSLIPS